MLSKTHRFHGYGSLKAVYSRGTTVRGQMVSARFMDREVAKPYRVAVVVSRKVSKSAVVRNRIRRRIYEAVRRNDQQVPPGTDLVLTVFSDQVAVIEADKLESAVQELLSKIAVRLAAAVQTSVSHGIIKPDTSEQGDA